MQISASLIPELPQILRRHAAETGYSPQMLEHGFARMFAHWNESQFGEFCRREIPGPLPGDILHLFDTERTLDERKALIPLPCAENLLLVSASTVPSASFQDVILSLLLPLRVSQRPACNLLPLFEDLQAALMRTAPLLASRWEILSPTHDDARTADALARHDVVSISGSDATVEHYRRLAAALPEPHPRIVAHGHRVSAAILRRGEIPSVSESDYAALAIDASVWDQTGCLSPKCLFVETDDAVIADGIARKLARHLDLVAETLPAVPPDTAQSAARNSALLMAELDGATVVRAPRNQDAVVSWPCGTSFRPLGLPRTLQVYPVRDAVEAAKGLRPHGQAIASLTPLSECDARELADCGYNYFCRFGEMQDPPLTWFHDGIGTLRPLFA